MQILSTEDRKIIGGLFPLPKPEMICSSNEKFKTLENVIFFANARSAIYSVIKALKPKNIWMPSYLCPSMLNIPLENNCNLNLYPVDDKLTISNLNWVKNINHSDIVVVIDYFGFPCSQDRIIEIKDKAAYVIEDASQALLSQHVGENSDYVIYSPRKFIGLPDSGILTYRNNLPNIPSPNFLPPNEWWLKSFNAVLLRQQWDYGMNEIRQEHWYTERKRAGKEIPCGSYCISTLSQAYLEVDIINWDNIRQKRKDNYNFLNLHLSSYALFKELDDKTTPLGFPIRVSSKRDYILRKFYEKKVYPPNHWNIKGSVDDFFKESHCLSSEEITIPCDQRYDLEDMEFIVNCFKEINENPK